MLELALGHGSLLTPVTTWRPPTRLVKLLWVKGILKRVWADSQNTSTETVADVGWCVFYITRRRMVSAATPNIKHTLVGLHSTRHRHQCASVRRCVFYTDRQRCLSIQRDGMCSIINIQNSSWNRA